MNGSALPLVPATVPSAPRRECGGCRLCCKVLAVQEIDKPRGQWCPHNTKPNAPGGCSIYDRRPAQCSDFQCLWLAVSDPEVAARSERLAETWARIFPLEERPDRIRAVFSPFLGGLRSPRTGVMHRAVALQRGSADLTRAQATIVRLLEANYAVFLNDNEKCLGAWIPHEPESVCWAVHGRIMGTAPVNSWPERKLDPRRLVTLWHPSLKGSQAEQLWDRTKATEEERARVDQATDQALAEIKGRVASGLDPLGEEVPACERCGERCRSCATGTCCNDEEDEHEDAATAEAHAEEARGLALDEFWLDDSGGEG